MSTESLTEYREASAGVDIVNALNDVVNRLSWSGTAGSPPAGKSIPPWVYCPAAIANTRNAGPTK